MVLVGLFYNKAIFEQCGITTLPTTMDELYAVCETIKSKGITPIACGIKDAWVCSEMITSTILPATVGSRAWLDKLYNKEIDFTDPGYVEMLQNLKDISQYFPEGYVGLGYEDCQQMFLSEQAAMYMSGSFEISYFQEMNPDLQLGAIAYPGKTGPATAMNLGIATGYGVNKNTEHMDECLTYLNWLASAEGTDVFANGVTGFYGMNVNAGPITNEASNEWLTASQGKELIQMPGYECMNTEVPDYTTAIADTVYQLLVNGMSPADAAAHMQEQMAWYFD
jgi:raffinose/stachyose/melibiose transport system substrate-binding protein